MLIIEFLTFVPLTFVSEVEFNRPLELILINLPLHIVALPLTENFFFFLNIGPVGCLLVLLLITPPCLELPTTLDNRAVLPLGLVFVLVLMAMCNMHPKGTHVKVFRLFFFTSFPVPTQQCPLMSV